MTTTFCCDKLDSYRVETAPPTIYYIPNFISNEEEEYLLNNVYSAPKPKWTQLSNRRLQNWGGLPHAKGMIAEDMPKWLCPYIEKIGALGVFEGKNPNHVLINEYEAGQGIMPHEDGDLFYPTVSTISLGSHTLLDFYRHQSHVEKDKSPVALEERYLLSVLLEPRSLVLVRDSMYKTHLHGITEKQVDIITDKTANLSMCDNIKPGDSLKRNTRVSLTIRVVPKVLKTKLSFLLGKR